jgi:thiopurine S-methyltransferase
MDPSFWEQRWERSEIGFHQEQVNLHLRECWPRLALQRGATVFVPLCGKSNDLLWLRDQGYRVIGVELSPIAVEAFFAENHLPSTETDKGRYRCRQHGDLTLLCGDYFDLEPVDVAGVGAVYDRASLIALPEDMRPRYVTQLSSLLGDRVPVLLVTLEYPEGQMDGPPFSVDEEEVRALYGGRYAIERLTARDVLRDNPHLRERGITALTEKAYLLNARDAGT